MKNIDREGNGNEEKKQAIKTERSRE